MAGTPRASPIETSCKQTASRLLKAELVLQGLSYEDLATKVASLGAHETRASIANKLSRGTFSAAFFLMCMQAIGVQHVNVPKNPREAENGISGG